MWDSFEFEIRSPWSMAYFLSIKTNSKTDASYDIKSREPRKQASGREPGSSFCRSIIKLLRLSVSVPPYSPLARVSLPRGFRRYVLLFIFTGKWIIRGRRQELVADIVRMIQCVFFRMFPQETTASRIPHRSTEYRCSAKIEILICKHRDSTFQPVLQIGESKPNDIVYRLGLFRNCVSTESRRTKRHGLIHRRADKSNDFQRSKLSRLIVVVNQRATNFHMGRLMIAINNLALRPAGYTPPRTY